MANSSDFRKTLILFLSFAAAAAVLFVLSLNTGKYPLDVSEIISGNADTMSVNVFETLRLPRSLMTVISGLALGLSGCTYQIIFRNPLASPDIIGVAGGANLGAAICIVCAFSGAASVAAGAFAGGIAAVFLVVLIAGVSGGRSAVTYLLAGIVINAVTSAAIISLKYFADPLNELVAIEYWEMGTFGNVTLSKFLSVIPFFAVGFAGTVLLRKQTELLSLEDIESKSLGVRVKPVRIWLLVFNTLLVASVISVTGLVAFVGLIAPHIARLALKRNDSVTLIFSALVGAVVVTGADILARSVCSVEVPVSVLTTVIVVPVLVVFLIKQRRQNI